MTSWLSGPSSFNNFSFSKKKRGGGGGFQQIFFYLKNKFQQLRNEPLITKEYILRVAFRPQEI